LKISNRFSAYEFGILYFYYTNESPKTLLEETMTMTKLINLQICPPLEDNNNINLILLPKTEAVVMFKFVPSDNPSTTYGYKTKY
jgi:Ni,Fe-hydrogenase I small subunit